MKDRIVEDDGEGYCPGDPTEFDMENLTKLERQLAKIHKIENPIEKARKVKEWQEALNG